MENGKNSTFYKFIKSTGVAIQHLLIAMPLIIAIPELFGSSVGLNQAEIIRITQVTILLCGIMTLLHASKHPVLGSNAAMVIGTDLAILAIGIRSASEIRLSTLFGMMILIAMLTWLLSRYAHIWYKYLTPAVLSATLLVYCISFLPVALDWFMGGVGAPDYGNSRNILVGGAVMAFTLFLNQYGKGFLKTGSIGLGIILGFSISVPLGLVKFNWSQQTSFLAIPEIMPYWPTLDLETMKWILPVLLVVLFKQIMDLSLYAKQIGLNHEEETLLFKKGLKTNALGYGLTFLLGAVPTSSPSQNLGFNAFGRADERSAIIISGVLLIIAGLIPSLAGIFTILPLPVLGAISVLLISALFNLVVTYMTSVKWNHKQLFVGSLAFLLGLLPLIRPEGTQAFGFTGKVILESGICISFLTGMFLELVIPEN